jgi:hypothetical protein
MYSKDLEYLIETSLAGEKLSENNIAELREHAIKEGVDFDELEIYIESIKQKRTLEKSEQLNKDIASHEKLCKGNVCPHCDAEIPPFTKICPQCKRLVNANETNEDKALFKLIDKINDALIQVKAAKKLDDFNNAKAECDLLITKAENSYGDIKKVHMLIFDLKEEIKVAEKKLLSTELKKELKSTTISIGKSIERPILHKLKYLCSKAWFWYIVTSVFATWLFFMTDFSLETISEFIWNLTDKIEEILDY